MYCSISLLGLKANARWLVQIIGFVLRLAKELEKNEFTGSFCRLHSSGSGSNGRIEMSGVLPIGCWPALRMHVVNNGVYHRAFDSLRFFNAFRECHHGRMLHQPTTRRTPCRDPRGTQCSRAIGALHQLAGLPSVARNNPSLA